MIILPSRVKSQLCLLQITEDNEYIEDQLCHELAKKYMNHSKSKKQIIIDMAERFESLG